jgi:hypothetical protein
MGGRIAIIGSGAADGPKMRPRLSPMVPNQQTLAGIWDGSSVPALDITLWSRSVVAATEQRQRDCEAQSLGSV